MSVKLHPIQKILFIPFLLVTTVAPTNEIHLVKKGETLTEILYSMKFRPVYGPNGKLENVLALNPAIKKSKGNKIYPGMKILLDPISEKTEIAKVELAPELVPKTQAIESNSDLEQYFFIRASAQVSWLKVNSSNRTQYLNSEITTLSNASPGFLGQYGMNISEKHNYYLFTYLSQVNFYPNETYSMEKKNFFRQAYGMGSDYKLDSVTNLSAKFGFYDEFFLSVPSLNAIKIESAQIPEIHFGVRRHLGSYKKFNVDSGVFGKFIIPFDAASIKGKFGYGLGGELLASLNSKAIRFFYHYSSAQAEGKSTNTHELGWNLVMENQWFD